MRKKGQTGYGLASVLLVILILAAAALEYKLDILERMGGSLMRWYNASRPREGRAWEVQTASASAVQDLGKLAAQQYELRQELQSRADFIRLPKMLDGGQILTLSREKFLDLYEQIPPVFARRFGSQDKFMDLSLASGWKRAAFIGRDKGLEVYYLDEENLVLARFYLEEDYFTGLQRWGMELQGQLEASADFSGRIYSAADFAAALNLAVQTGEEFLPAVELLKRSAPLNQVGISRRWQSGTVEMAFQFSDGKTFLYPVSDNFAAKIMEYLPETVNCEQ